VSAPVHHLLSVAMKHAAPLRERIYAFRRQWTVDTVTDDWSRRYATWQAQFERDGLFRDLTAAELRELWADGIILDDKGAITHTPK
jgi:hypothetical protein